jgi:hypothetical protein
MRRPSVTSARLVTSVIAVALTLAGYGGIARALPAPTPDHTWMVNGPRVQSITVGQELVYVAGRFTLTRASAGGDALRARNLVAFDLETGVPAWTTPFDVTDDADPDQPAVVWDTALSANGAVLYVCGSFDRVAGQAQAHVAALDAATGAVLEGFAVQAPPCRSLDAAGPTLVVGGARAVVGLGFDGTPAWKVSTDGVVRSVASDGTWVYAGGRFRTLDGVDTGLVGRIDAATGALDPAWVVGPVPIALDDPEGVFALDLVPWGDSLYVAAGGDDFAARFDLATGAVRWATDTSGSAQAIEPMGDGTVIVGGHFRWVADADTTDCGTNPAPVDGCASRLRLAAIDEATGALIEDWAPRVTGAYNGVWALALDPAGRLHVGGEFTEIERERRTYYARLSPLP